MQKLGVVILHRFFRRRGLKRSSRDVQAKREGMRLFHLTRDNRLVHGLQHHLGQRHITQVLICARDNNPRGVIPMSQIDSLRRGIAQTIELLMNFQVSLADTPGSTRIRHQGSASIQLSLRRKMEPQLQNLHALIGQLRFKTINQMGIQSNLGRIRFFTAQFFHQRRVPGTKHQTRLTTSGQAIPITPHQRAHGFFFT